MNEIIKEIIDKNNIHEDFIEVQTSGLANKIYMSNNFVLRIPTDHEEAISDALTESVAAPIAYSHGIKTPRLICFDNSYSILNKSYSIWERIHGLTFGELKTENYKNIWYEFGKELGKIHKRITECPDPNGWLDSADREDDIDSDKRALYTKQCKSEYLLNCIENYCTEKTYIYRTCFVHGDTHPFNILCGKSNKFLSIIDWGDAGWADPAIDYYMIPIESIHYVLDGYQEESAENINFEFLSRIILDKIFIGFDENKDTKELENSIKLLEKNLKAFFERLT